MTREEELQQYLNARKKEKKRRGGNFPSTQAPEWEACVLEKDKTQVFRFLGKPYQIRKDPSDMLLVKKSFIVGDDGKSFPVIWSDDPAWPLRKLYNFITKYTWDQEANNGKGQKIFHNDGCPLLKQVLTNGRTNPYETGWRWRDWVIANVIDRMDGWCKENKHSKVIAWDANDTGEKIYYNYGMTSGMFKIVSDVLVTETGMMPHEFDLVVRRFSEPTANNVYYKLFNGTKQKEAIKNLGFGENIPIVDDLLLSSEEQEYELYTLEDAPFLTQVTPLSVIEKKLGKFFKKVDKKYDTAFYEELLEEAEMETAEFLKKNNISSSKENIKTEVKTTETNSDSKPTRSRKVNNSNSVEKKEKESVNFWTEIESNSDLKGIPMLNNEEREEIIGYDSDSEELKFNSNNQFAPCDDCGKSFPTNILTCPYCGKDYNDDIEE